MSRRRVLLSAGLFALFVSAAERRATGATTTEIEMAGYGGESHGGWVCGPTGRLAYGGLGAGVRVSERERTAQHGEGWTGRLAGNAERQSIELDPCATDCTARGTATPPTRLMFAGRARVGYRWRYVGVEAGGGVFEGWEGNTSTSTGAYGYPELELRGGGGEPVAVNGVVGFGSPLVTTTQRPGAYGGASVEVEKVAVELLGGLYRSGPGPFDEAAGRADVVVRVPLVEHVQLRAGGSAGEPTSGRGGPNWEASGGLVSSF